MAGRRSSEDGSVVQQALPIYYALALAILTFFAIQLLLRLEDVLLVLFISVLFAATVSRPAALLERHKIPRLLAAPEHRDTTRDVLTKMWARVGYYLRAKLIVMAIVGGLMYGALWLIGVEFPLLLAIVVALGQLIPRVAPGWHAYRSSPSPLFKGYRSLPKHQRPWSNRLKHLPDRNDADSGQLDPPTSGKAGEDRL